jgi:subtilase family serine protease
MTLRRTARVLPIAVASGALLAASLTATATTSLAEESTSTTASWVKTSEDDVPTATFTAVVPYDRSALRRLARQVSRPDGRRFREFLTVEQAAAQVGVTRKARRDLRERARELGIEVAFDGTGLTAQLTAPLDTWVDIYGTQLELTDAAPMAVSVFVPNATNTSYEPDVPLVLRGLVQKIFPIDTEVVPQSVSAAMERPINEGTPFGPGAECILEGNREFTYSPNQLHVPYGTAALHEQGIRGEGARLGVIGIGQVFDPGLAEIAGECFEYEVPRLDVVGAPGIGDLPVSAGPTIGVESNLDVQVSTAVLPAAPAVAFVETVGSLSFMQNLIQGYTTALTVLNPDVLTLSYGACVSALKESGDWQPRRYVDDLFAFAGIVGTSVLIAAGDSGSSGCLHGGGADASIQADYPAASPWATAVGGTRIILGEGNRRVSEVVWNSTTWDPQLQGAGGGAPAPYPSPWYQRSISSADRRLVPDVVAHAAVSPGWPVVMTPAQYATGPWPALPPGADWGIAPIGGTSAASPFTAANIALIASQKGRLGFLNPWLYSLAQSNYRSAFYDIVDGDNMVDPEPACCPAIKGYDMASGLGAPNFDALLELTD